MPKPTVPMLATKAKRYNRKDLRPGKVFDAKPEDVKMLKILGWAVDPPPPRPVKSAGTYQTTALKAAE